MIPRVLQIILRRRRWWAWLTFEAVAEAGTETYAANTTPVVAVRDTTAAVYIANSTDAPSVRHTN